MNHSVSTLISLFFILGAHVAPALAMGGCLSAPRDPNDVPPVPQPWTQCKNRPKKWACESKKIDFPTVECLKKDMETCGNVGTGPTIFYSFGAETIEVRKPVRDTKNPKGVMWNDALDASYTEMLAKRKNTFKLDRPERQKVYNARYAEALASLSKGEVFFGVLHYNGKYGGHGAYQNVRTGESPEDNTWIQYEFPTLQHKSRATKVTTFAISDGSYHVDWERGVKGDLKPYHDASKLAVPVVKRSDESNTCALDNNPKDYEKDEEECEE
ncbi:uncharacterized protein ACHE_70256S [Aspergillus chevalieri]|uniref:Uncharacterized protein n=1 Tax=Aspergillus chevalieri TaxID=182096 RepID=A0A7R7ZR41_ASPCH|nr:uncharacterized protein ACHE_70256S [Aspergillus chevalieri]BCR91413.1 hypothetical protein ACHE_70256S [Aspergillus chevalieri]